MLFGGTDFQRILKYFDLMGLNVRHKTPYEDIRPHTVSDNLSGTTCLRRGEEEAVANRSKCYFPLILFDSNN